MILSEQEKNLVEQHLSIIEPIIYKFVNEKIQGLGYDDLYQTACEALCYSAQKYVTNRGACFKTFATTVIKNKLIDCYRKFNKIQSKVVSLDDTIDDISGFTYYDILPSSQNQNIDTNILTLLNEIERGYDGITKKGVHALKLHYLGYSRNEIARKYKQKSNYVSAWMSRAKQKLRTHDKILELQAN